MGLILHAAMVDESAMMRRMLRVLLAVALLSSALASSPALAQPAAAPAAPQTQEDDYTRYELLAPGTGQFRILYEVTATTAGAPYFFNVIRKVNKALSYVTTGQDVPDDIEVGRGRRLAQLILGGAA